MEKTTWETQPQIGGIKSRIGYECVEWSCSHRRAVVNTIMNVQAKTALGAGVDFLSS
jgi:hypothetical protein